MRDRVLREEPTCRVDACDEPATEDDHIIGWSQREARGLSVSDWHRRSNHQGLCSPHHQLKTQAEARVSREQKSAKRTPRRHPSEGGGNPPKR